MRQEANLVCRGPGVPSLVILEEASSKRPDLIIVGSHHRTGLQRFLLGSVSHAVLQRANCPVLVMKG